MEPSRTDRDAVVDLLDVILEEGVIVQADVVIAVADIPLIGLQLRAALAGIDTMTDYGLLEDWDESARRRARNRSAAAPAPTERTSSSDPGPPPASDPAESRSPDVDADADAEPDLDPNPGPTADGDRDG